MNPHKIQQWLGATGLLAGYFPAKEASRLDPVVAMKL